MCNFREFLLKSIFWHGFQRKLNLNNPSMRSQANMRAGMKRKFTPEEDLLITEEVKKLGSTDWTKLAEKIPGRNGRQIRERWVNYLSPDVNRGPWTLEEDASLEEYVRTIGKKWSQIASHFPNRTDVMLKNHYILLQRRRTRSYEQMMLRTLVQKPNFVQILEPPVKMEHADFLDVPIDHDDEFLGAPRDLELPFEFSCQEEPLF